MSTISNKKLMRSKTDRKICGVCGGLAEFLHVDVSLIRLIWVLSCFGGGSGILVYLLAAVIIPED